MTDTRDLRDPQKLGETLLYQAPLVRKAYGNDISLSGVYDHHVSKFDLPDYAHDESIAQIAAREYREELEARDDPYAKSALEALNKGEKVEGYDDAGA